MAGWYKYVAIISCLFFFITTTAGTCPTNCLCSTTIDGLHKAVCSNIDELYKYTKQHKHHNINILNLSHNNITKVDGQLDRLVELVSLDLSTNGITSLNKFLINGKKIVHLNLANNRIERLSTTVLPRKLSSLDLSDNLLKDVPYELASLKYLEHLILKGNPLDCSCMNLLERDVLLKNNVIFDDVKCASPDKYKGTSWLELKTKEICKSKNSLSDEYLFEMMGDDPSVLNNQPSIDLSQGDILDSSTKGDNDDAEAYMDASELGRKSSYFDNVEGSGYRMSMQSEGLITTDEPTINSEEGSGEYGSGSFFRGSDDIIDETTEHIDLYTDPVKQWLGVTEDPSDNITDIPESLIPTKSSIFEGKIDWDGDITEKPIPKVVTDETVSEKIQVTKGSVLTSEPTTDSKPMVHKTGTYVCIAIIIALLVSLVAFAITKSQLRKRRDKRLLRQQKRDVEKASKEMVDMNKSLLGKPAAPSGNGKKVNGNYELVPTHDTRKSENGNISKPSPGDKNSPRDSNQNRPIASLEKTPQDENKTDANSLSSSELFVPIDGPHLNGFTDSDLSPIGNDDTLNNSDLLSPSGEYVPVYSPDMGRVRIKMTETPKPKTPVLVNRSRSNAGDIIITPATEQKRTST